MHRRLRQHSGYFMNMACCQLSMTTSVFVSSHSHGAAAALCADGGHGCRASSSALQQEALPQALPTPGASSASHAA
jgi:hypothetical protein